MRDILQYRWASRSILSKFSSFIIPGLTVLYLVSGKATIPRLGNWSEVEIRNLLAPIVVLTSVYAVLILLKSRTFFWSDFRNLNPYVSILMFFSLNVLFIGSEFYRSSHLINVFHLLNALVALVMVSRDEKSTLNLLRIIFLGSFSLSLMALFGFNVPNTGDLSFYDEARNFDVWSPLSSTTTFYRLMFFGAAAGLSLISFTRSRYVKFLFLNMSFFLIIAAFKSTAFAVPFTFFSGLYFGFVLLFSIRRFRKGLIFLAVGSFIGVVGVSLTINSLTYELRTQVSGEIDCRPECSLPINSGSEGSGGVGISQGNTNDYTTLILEDKSQRLGLLQTGFELFKENPILGSGWGNYSRKGIIDGYGTLGDYTYAHNLIVDVLSQSGIVGFLFFLLFLTFVSIGSTSRCLRDGKIPYFLIFGFIILLGNLVGGDYYDFRFFGFALLISNRLSTPSPLKI
jgi:hypothetical protein